MTGRRRFLSDPLAHILEKRRKVAECHDTCPEKMKSPSKKRRSSKRGRPAVQYIEVERFPIRFPDETRSEVRNSLFLLTGNSFLR